MNQGRRTYYEMIIAIILQAILISILGMITSGQFFLFPVSVIIGSTIAIGLLGHMYRSIDAALDMDPDSAKKYGRRQAVVRMALMGMALCIAFYYMEYINPWGVLLGVVSLKFSAYLQPVVHILIKHIYKKRRERGK